MNGAGGKSAGVMGAPLPLSSWEAHRTAPAMAPMGVGPVPEGPCKPVQAGRVGLLAVLGPPGGDLLLGAVPFPPQLRQGPRYLDVVACTALVETGLDQLKAPVVGDPGGAAVGRPGLAAVAVWGPARTDMLVSPWPS